MTVNAFAQSNSPSFNTSKSNGLPTSVLFPKGVETISHLTGLSVIQAQQLKNTNSSFSQMAAASKTSFNSTIVRSLTNSHNLSFITPNRKSFAPISLIQSSMKEAVSSSMKHSASISTLNADDTVYMPIFKVGETYYPMVHSVKGESSLSLYTDMSKMPESIEINGLKAEIKETTLKDAMKYVPENHALLVNPKSENRWFSPESVDKLKRAADEGL